MDGRRFNRITAALLIGMVVSCTTKKPESKALKIHFPAVKLNLDPQKMEDLYSMAVVTQIYRGLLRYDAHGEVAPDLAESWSESDDHKTYRFKLRKMTFSDGTPITSDHVQITFARMFLNGASMGADLDYIAGVEKFKTSKRIEDLGIRILGASTVEFQLARPSALFLKQLAVTDCGILPITKPDQTLDTSPSGVFSGPYKVARGPDEQGVSIEKWRKDVHDSSSPPDAVIYFFATGRPVAAALDGKTDCLDHDRVTDEDRQKLHQAGWVQTPTELTGEVFVILNPNLIPADERRELYSLVDSDEIARSLNGHDRLTPAFGLIPYGLPGELGKDAVSSLKNRSVKYTGPKAPIELEYEATSELEQKLGNMLKEKWEVAGIPVKLKPISKSEKLGRMFGKKAQALIGRKSLDYPDGISVLNYFKGNYDSNYFYVNDPAIDSELLKAIQIFDAIKREQAYKEIQRKILAHYTVIPLLFGTEASGLWSASVRSVPSHSLGLHTLPVESIEMRKL